LSFFGNAEAVEQLQAGVAPEKIVAGWTAALAAFDEVRRKYFLYKFGPFLMFCSTRER